MVLTNIFKKVFISFVVLISTSIFVEAEAIKIYKEDGTQIYPESCFDIKGIIEAQGEVIPPSDIYSIYPNNIEMEVYCNMRYQGGGWTLVWSNLQNVNQINLVDRAWDKSANYTGSEIVGDKTTKTTNFNNGTPEKFEAFIGLKGWNAIMGTGGAEFAYLWKENNTKTYIDQSFKSDIEPFETEKYTLKLSNYQQRDGSQTAGLWWYHNNRPFSTNDRRNSALSVCGGYYSKTPFWYHWCWRGSMNGGGPNYGGGLYNGAYWTWSHKLWARSNGLGAGAGWYFIRPKSYGAEALAYITIAKEALKEKIKQERDKRFYNGDNKELKPESCLDIREIQIAMGITPKSEIYNIYPTSSIGEVVPMKVYCNMEYQGGGWTLVWSNLQEFNGINMVDRKWDMTANYSGAEIAGNTDLITENFKKGTPDAFEAFIGLKGWNHIMGNKTAEFATLWKKSQEYINLDQSGIADIEPFATKKYVKYQGGGYTLKLSNYQQKDGLREPGLVSGGRNGANNNPFSTNDRRNSGNSGCSSYYSRSPFWYYSCWNGSLMGGGESYIYYKSVYGLSHWYKSANYLDGAYWYGTSSYVGKSDGYGAGAGWYFIRPKEVSEAITIALNTSGGSVGCSEPGYELDDNGMCVKDIYGCAAGYELYKDTVTGIWRCNGKTTENLIGQEVLQCDNYGEINDGASIDGDKTHVCKVNIMVEEGDDRNIIIRKYDINENISIGRMKELTNEWTEPLRLVAKDGKGNISMWVKKANVSMSFQKEIEEERNFYWYSCEEPWKENYELDINGEEKYQARGLIENGSHPEACIVDRYLNCEE